MAVQGETLFGLIRRRDNIKFYAAQKRASLPSQFYEAPEYPGIATDPQAGMRQDLDQLDIQKKRHLVIPNQKGGKKLNKLSFLGFLIGLLIAGSLFFIAGFCMCYSFYPPYGGILFEPKYATAPQGQPLSSLPRKAKDLTEPESVSPQAVPAQSYADRQAMLGHLEGRPSEPGLLEKAEQRTFDNAKQQLKDSMIQGIRSLTDKLSDKLGPAVSSILSPLTEDLPADLIEQPSSDSSVEPENNNQSTIDPVAHSSSTPLTGSATVPSLKELPLSPSSPQTVPIKEKRGLYSLRVRRFNERASALKLSEELKSKGFSSYVIGLWNENHLEFEVRSGSYNHFSQAQNARKILDEHGVGFTTIVMVGSDEEPLKS